ncbi:MAG TPA: transcriptional repressor LexA, partial [Burkholderiales bacterium]|nr:transcriptional repressor LexA [Burkholderiales bacterium]
RVAAGSPILAQEHIAQRYACDPALFTSRPDYLLKVRGMSMRDAGILDGDLLAVQKKTEAKEGQIVVARIGDDVTVKRFHRIADGIELIAENPDYENILVKAGSSGGQNDFALEGIAVGLIRPTEF